MTVNNSTNKVVASGNGVQTVFDFAFIAVDAGDLEVILTDSSGNETTLLPAQYAVTLNPTLPGQIWSIGGTVAYPLTGSPIPMGSTITIVRELSLTQLVALGNQGNEFPSAVETALDLLEMQLQQINELFQRAIVAPVVDATAPLPLPPIAQRANQGMGFDSAGNPVAIALPASGVISTAMQPVVDAATLALGRAAFGLGSVATENIGSGLVDDGSGNLRVNNPIVEVAANQTVTAAFDFERFIATGPINFTCPRADTLWNGFGFWIEAAVGDVTLVIDSHDQVSGNPASGTSFTIPAGANVFVTTDAATSGIWYIEGMPWLVQNVRTNGVAGTYNISASDNAKILKNNSGTFGTFIFPAGNTLRSDFRCLIINGETSPIGKGVGGTNLGSFTMYPGQAYLVINDSGTMRVVGSKQLYVVNSVALFVDMINGSDNLLIADGLSNGTRARKTANGGRAQLYQDFDHNGSQPSITFANGTIQESVTWAGQPINAGVFFVNGTSPQGTIWQPPSTSSPFCWIVGDGCVLEYSNIQFDGSNITGSSTAIQRHQTGICDQNSGVGFGNFSSSGSHITSDGIGAEHNINASYSVTGGAANHISTPSAAFVSITGNITVTISNTPTFSDWYRLVGSGANISLGSGITYSGSIASGCQKWFSGTGSVITFSGGSGSVPGSIVGNPAVGSAPTSATGWANA